MICLCNTLKEFRPVNSNNSVTYQCECCKKIYLARDIDITKSCVVKLQKTDNPFKYYVRKPIKKD